MSQVWVNSKVSIAVVFLLALYVALACFHIERPGIQYDEALFMNVARGVIDPHVFIFASFQGIPILLMSYIGALKSYLYYPILKLFGVSAISIRLPSILLSAVGIFYWFKTFRKARGTGLSLYFLLLCALDPTGIFHARADWGPTTLNLLCRSLLFYILIDLDLRSTKKIMFLACVAGLGLFNKLDFLWAVAGAFSAYILVNRQLIFIGTPKRRLIFTAVLLGAVTVPFALRARHLAISELSGQAFRWHNRWIDWSSMLHCTLDGTGPGGYFFNSPFDLPKFPLLLLMGTFCVLPFAYRQLKDPDRFLLFAFIAMIAELFFTKQAMATHHSFELFPLHWCVILVALDSLPWRRVCVAAGALALVTCFICGDLSYFRRLSDSSGIRSMWSPEIYGLVSTLSKLKSPHDVWVIDWGLGTPLLALDPVHPAIYRDIWPMVNGLREGGQNSSSAAAVSKIFAQGSTEQYVVGYKPGQENMKGNTEAFTSLAEHQGAVLTPVALPEGSPYVLWKVVTSRSASEVQ